MTQTLIGKLFYSKNNFYWFTAKWPLFS